MIDLHVNQAQLARTVSGPGKTSSFPMAWQKDPTQLRFGRSSGMSAWDVDSEPVSHYLEMSDLLGGGFGPVNFLSCPELTGASPDCRPCGQGFHRRPLREPPMAVWSPAWSPANLTLMTQKAVRQLPPGAPSTPSLVCESIAILPEGMSRERFQWLGQVAGEIIATAGSESNVKEIFDKCWELRRTRDNIVIFNQFEEEGNYLWHYEVTGSAMEELLSQLMESRDRFAGLVVTTGSAGTIASGDRLKQSHPQSKVAASEALQCPTLLNNGFGAHRIEGIGDKHVPWIHNVRNTDMVIAIDDRDTMALLRLFNEEVGQQYLREQGVGAEDIEKLSLLGISGVANLLSCIKFARYYQLTERDVVMTVFTDSMEMYGSRLTEMEAEEGPYSTLRAAVDYHCCLLGQKTDNIQELSFADRQRIHNLKVLHLDRATGPGFGRAQCPV